MVLNKQHSGSLQANANSTLNHLNSIIRQKLIIIQIIQRRRRGDHPIVR